MTQETVGKTFRVDKKKCVSCGECVTDCVAEIITMKDKTPVIAPENYDDCIGCQHCLAICPVGAVSIMGANPDASAVQGDVRVDVDALAALVRKRRSCRRFTDTSVDPALLQKLLGLMAYAPTGVNNMGRRFTVIGDREVMNRFRTIAVEKILAADAKATVPEDFSWIVDMAKDYAAGGKDSIFRGAPHMLLVSNPASAPCPDQDALIALSYFDILANAHGLGTVWAGIPYWVLKVVVPELRQLLGVPDDHENFYTLLFGNPAITYARSVQRKPEDINLVALL